MRQPRVSEMAQLSVIAAMFLAAFATLPTAPAAVPIRWNGNGQVTGYTSPEFVLLLVPVIGLVAYLAFRLLPLIDPGRANYSNFGGIYTLLRLTITLVLAAVDVVIHLAVRGVSIDVGLLAPITFGVLLVLAGNIAGKLRPNWFVGIVTPWTLSSKRSWTRTQVVGGRVLVLAGILFMLIPAARLVGLRSLSVLPFALALLALALIYIVTYSFFTWRNDPQRISPAGTLPVEHT